MLVGIPTEIKAQEERVGMTPGSVRELVERQHQVLVQSHAGNGIGATDSDYRQAGAKITKSAKEVYRNADMIVKVKEPLAVECRMLRAGQTLFTYLHLAANRDLTESLLRSRATCIAYETVTSDNGTLPLLTPMSRIAGRLATQAGANCLLKHWGGSGKLISGGGGVAPVKVVVIGTGVVGINAARAAIGMGARVTILDKSLEVLSLAERELPGVIALYSNKANLEEQVSQADIVIGAVLLPGMAAPKLVNRQMVKSMNPGSVLVDVAIDQGGCFATSKPTTHEQPIYVIDHVVHYCVTNMPGAVPHTAAHALNHATLPHILHLAGGVRKALQEDKHLRAGLATIDGKLICAATAKSLKLKCHAALSPH